MRVLFLSQYYFPETGATSNRIFSFVKYFAQHGHEVFVVAEKPNHPEGIILPEYRGAPFLRRWYRGIPVVYCWVFTRPKKTFVTRLVFYLSFMVSAIIGATIAFGRIDVVIASSPPLFVGPAGWTIAKLKRAKFVFDVRDLWPDLAIALGTLRSPTLSSLARILERLLYRKSNAVTGVTGAFCDHISAMVKSSKPLERVMNGTFPEIFQRDQERERKREILRCADHFVVLFAGNIGINQGLGHVVVAAQRLQRQGSNVLFLFLGSGPAKEHLMADVAERRLHNVRFLPRTTLEGAAEHMAAADALLVPLGDHPVYRKFIPSKLFDSMAAGRPVLLSVDGEARAILEKADAGIYYPAEDAEGLVKAVLRLKADPDVAAEMGRNGRKFAVAYCSREEQARVMTRFIENIVGERKESTCART